MDAEFSNPVSTYPVEASPECAVANAAQFSAVRRYAGGEIGNGVLGVQLNPRPFYYCPVDRLSVVQTVGRVIHNIRGRPPHKWGGTLVIVRVH